MICKYCNGLMPESLVCYCGGHLTGRIMWDSQKRKTLNRNRGKE